MAISKAQKNQLDYLKGVRFQARLDLNKKLDTLILAYTLEDSEGVRLFQEKAKIEYQHAFRKYNKALIQLEAYRQVLSEEVFIRE